MAHLPVSKDDGKIDLSYPLQRCVNRARRYERYALIAKTTLGLSGVVILILIQFWEPAAGPSIKNTIIVNVILAAAAITSFAAGLASIFNFERQTIKHATASRAINRLTDRYEFEVDKSQSDADKLRLLETWVRSHIYKIERLLEDPLVLDVDRDFKISDPERPNPAC